MNGGKTGTVIEGWLYSPFRFDKFLALFWVLVQKSCPWNIATKGTGTNEK
jgi:hypothetical protein